MSQIPPIYPVDNPQEWIDALLNEQLTLSFLAEGAANVIYKVQPKDPSIRNKYMNCCVLRMRKELDFTRPAVKVMADFKEQIYPLFAPDYVDVLMPQALYRLTSDMIKAADDLLLREEALGRRPNQRVGIFHPRLKNEEYAILMPNLARGYSTVLIEFKPKWLVQSPSAPEDATRCRTCALNAVRRAEGRELGRGDSGFCPLDLMSTDDLILRNALAYIFHAQQGLDKFVIEFKSKVQPAILHLKKLQELYGRVAFKDFSYPVDPNLPLAMALRDCSIFLNIMSLDDEQRGVEQSGDFEIFGVKLADLDLKSTGGGKLEKWATMETDLLSSGAYIGLIPSHIDCALSRS